MEDHRSPRNIRSVVTGTGSYIPTQTVRNEDFLARTFYDAQGNVYDGNNTEIVLKFEKITGIQERRYVTDELQTSDIAAFAAQDALESSGIDREELDYLIVAHNFGDVRADNRRSDFVPSLASRVKHALGIRNPATVAYDIAFGCPGWVQGMIQADYYLRSGDARRVLVVGAETLSRVSDPHDRDSMIYSDGAGATILEAIPTAERVGILAHVARTDTVEQSHLLCMDKSYSPNGKADDLYLKMDGRSVYNYALAYVPTVVKESLDRAGLTLGEVCKVLIHQANAKMDEAILKRLARLCGVVDVPAGIMPMTISWLGNSSVATVPTLLDLLYKGKLGEHGCRQGDVLVFTSVGAGMNINAIVYRIP